jgi:heme/copper-type cytochrome/quinol oxidase subunit 2
MILLSPEARFYNSFVQAWKQVGDVENDGWFVMKHPEVLGVVKDLTTGKLIDLRSQSQQPQQEDISKVKEIRIDLSNYKFEPSSISVKKGEKIKLILTSKDVYHTFTVDELGISIEVFPGQTVTKEILVDKSGAFRLYCVPHESLGMVGEFVVE